ncbi:MAG: hypothetical protein ACLUEV_11500 [Alistipes sp.]
MTSDLSSTFRDPHVVWNSKKIWWLACTLFDRRLFSNVGLYTSTDLTRWTPHTSYYLSNSVSGDCPDVSLTIYGSQLCRLSLYAGR